MASSTIQRSPIQRFPTTPTATTAAELKNICEAFVRDSAYMAETINVAEVDGLGKNFIATLAPKKSAAAKQGQALESPRSKKRVVQQSTSSTQDSLDRNPSPQDPTGWGIDPVTLNIARGDGHFHSVSGKRTYTNGKNIPPGQDKPYYYDQVIMRDHHVGLVAQVINEENRLLVEIKQSPGIPSEKGYAGIAPTLTTSPSRLDKAIKQASTQDPATDHVADLHEVLVKLGFDPKNQGKGILTPIEPNRIDNKENAYQWVFGRAAELNKVTTKGHVWVDETVLHDPIIHNLVTADLWMALGMKKGFASVLQQENQGQKKSWRGYFKDGYTGVKKMKHQLICW